MTEAEKLQAQVREFPEAMAIIDRIRAALAEALFLTPIGAKDEREAMYLRVATLDVMKSEMQALMNEGAGSKAIQAYVDELGQAQ